MNKKLAFLAMIQIKSTSFFLGIDLSCDLYSFNMAVINAGFNITTNDLSGRVCLGLNTNIVNYYIGCILSKNYLNKSTNNKTSKLTPSVFVELKYKSSIVNTSIILKFINQVSISLMISKECLETFHIGGIIGYKHSLDEDTKTENDMKEEKKDLPNDQNKQKSNDLFKNNPNRSQSTFEDDSLYNFVLNNKNTKQTNKNTPSKTEEIYNQNLNVNASSLKDSITKLHQPKKPSSQQKTEQNNQQTRLIPTSFTQTTQLSKYKNKDPNQRTVTETKHESQQSETNNNQKPSQMVILKTTESQTSQQNFKPRNTNNQNVNTYVPPLNFSSIKTLTPNKKNAETKNNNAILRSSTPKTTRTPTRSTPNSIIVKRKMSPQNKEPSNLTYNNKNNNLVTTSTPKQMAQNENTMLRSNNNANTNNVNLNNEKTDFLNQLKINSPKTESSTTSFVIISPTSSSDSSNDKTKKTITLKNTKKLLSHSSRSTTNKNKTPQTIDYSAVTRVLQYEQKKEKQNKSPNLSEEGFTEDTQRLPQFQQYFNEFGLNDAFFERKKELLKKIKSSLTEDGNIKLTDKEKNNFINKVKNNLYRESIHKFFMKMSDTPKLEIRCTKKSFHDSCLILIELKEQTSTTKSEYKKRLIDNFIYHVFSLIKLDQKQQAIEEIVKFISDLEEVKKLYKKYQNQ